MLNGIYSKDKKNFQKKSWTVFNDRPVGGSAGIVIGDLDTDCERKQMSC